MISNHNGVTFQTLDKIEQQIIIERLKQFRNNITATAISLGIGRMTLYRRLQRYGVK